MKNRAYIIKVDNTIRELDHRPTLEEAQEIVGGWIEQIRTPRTTGVAVFGDEEGKMKNKPLNLTATNTYGVTLVGDILVLNGWKTLR